MMKKSLKKLNHILYLIVRAVLLIGLAFVLLYPLLYMISVAFRSASDLFDPTVVWIPRTLTLSNLTDTFNIMNYPAAVLNTVMVGGVSAVLQIVTCSLCGYGLSRFNFKGRTFFFLCVLFTIIVPPQTTIIPLYLQFKFFDFLGLGSIPTILGGPAITINLLNTPMTFYLSAVLGMGINSGLFIYIFRQFFSGLPKELEDAAYIDGCGVGKTFLRIIISNATPALVTVFMFSIVWYWNDIYYSSMYFSNINTVSMALSGLASRLAILDSSLYDPFKAITMMQAGCLLTIAPLLVVYVFLQRKLTESIVRAGIVG